MSKPWREFAVGVDEVSEGVEWGVRSATGLDCEPN